MKSSIILLFFVFTCTFQCLLAQSTYKAAVVEFSPSLHSDVETLLLLNTADYLTQIENAKQQGAEIIVFPEYGLTSLKYNGSDAFSTYVPNPKDNISPCRNTSHFSKHLIDISCSADANDIYVVINLVEKKNDTSDEIIHYNTNVVFDRKGVVIARYRKINPFDEDNITPGNELVTFSTDFGVTFGVMICFDILFENPSVSIAKNVTDVIFSTAWFSETPFLTALSVQSGYARANGVNLLASGYSNPTNGSGGSGIYAFNGEDNIKIFYAPTTQLIISDVPKLQTNNKTFKPSANKDTRGIIGELPDVDNFYTQLDNLQNYTFAELNLSSLVPVNVCHQDFCCSFNVSATNNNSNVTYKLAAYDGPRYYGSTKVFIRVCGIISCETNEISSCGKRVASSKDFVFESIKINTMVSSTDGAFYFPTTLKTDLYPVDENKYDYRVFTDEALETHISMTLLGEQNALVGFGIYGRLYGISSSSMPQTLGFPIIALIMAFLYFK